MSDGSRDRWFEWFLRICPPHFRADAGAELRRMYRDGLARAERNGRLGALRFRVVTGVDLVRTAFSEWRGRPARISDAPGRTRDGSPDGGFRRSGGRWRTDLRWIGRRFRRSFGRSILSVLTLGVGIAATVLTLLLVRDVLLRPLPFPEPERLVRLTELNEEGRAWWPSFPNIVDWRAEADFLDGLVAAEVPTRRSVLIGGAEGVLADVAGVSRGFWSVLGVDASIGRTFTPEENQPGASRVAVVSWGFWRDRLGARELSGERVTVGTERVQVVGVLPPDFGFLSDRARWGEADIYLPLEQSSPEVFGGRQTHGFHVVARLPDGMNHVEAQNRLNQVAESVRTFHGEPTHAFRIGMEKLSETVTSIASGPLRLLSVASVLVLLLTCFNVGGVLLAKGLERSREFSVILALGARRADLTRYLVLESATLALSGGAAAVALVYGSLSILRGVSVPSLPRLASVQMDWRMMAATVAVAALSALLAGLVPAVLLPRRWARDGRAARQGRGDLGGGRIWNGFIAAQVAVSTVLLVGVGLLLSGFLAHLRFDRGFESRGVFVADVSLPEAIYASDEARLGFYDRALSRIETIPGVRAVGVTNVLPQDMQAWIAGTGRVGSDTEWGYASIRFVSSGYLDAIGVQTQDGRSPEDVFGEPSSGESVGLIDRNLATRYWPGGSSAVGGEVTNSQEGPYLRIGGVVAAIESPDVPVGSIGAVYLDYRTAPALLGEMKIVVAFERGAEIPADALRAALLEVDSRVPWSVDPLDDLLARERVSRRVLLTIVAVFSAIGLGLAVLGVYGLVAFVTHRRRREVAVRIALGARPSTTGWFAIRIGARPGGIGMIVGGLAAIPVSTAIPAIVGDIPPATTPLLALAASITFLATVAASYLPSRRMLNIDPSRILRQD